MYVHGWVYLEVLKLRARWKTHMHVFLIGEARPYGELSDILVDDHCMQHLTTEVPVAISRY